MTRRCIALTGSRRCPPRRREMHQPYRDTYTGQAGSSWRFSKTGCRRQHDECRRTPGGRPLVEGQALVDRRYRRRAA